MYWLLHWLLIVLYAAAPVAMGIYALERRRIATTVHLLVTITIGSFFGTAGTIGYARIVEGHASLGQILLASYFATALVLMLRGLDGATRKILSRLARPASGGTKPQIPPEAGRAKLNQFFSTAVRGIILIGIGLPYLLCVVLIYRPKVIPREDPMTQLGVAYQAVEFRSTDGVRLSGWWIPASPRRRHRRAIDEPADKTVLICHGMAADKSSQLILAAKLIHTGYNALSFDFRGHGQSDGQVTTLGDLERRDVLGAVRWLRNNHPQQSKRIVGVGADTGAAALIAAASERSDEGQAIAAVAVYGTFDDLESLSRDVGSAQFLPPMNWIAPRLGLRLASVHAGTNLAAFKPALLVHDIWPRPIFVIHGSRDQMVPFDHGVNLFEMASPPKQHLWLPNQDHNETIFDEDAADAVRDFFEMAKPMPII